jgi:hypothetical protein
VSRGRIVFPAAVFLGAFLVFQVQPLTGKYILPWYGGSAAVWTTCLVVFQSLLFAGYAWAHLLGRLERRRQALAHVLLLLAASLVSIVPAEAWKPRGDENPLTRIVPMLLVTVGLPYFALSASGPLLQAWSWRVAPGRSPYPLYALSNAGSLLALVSYPLLVEPFLSGKQQAALWRVAFVVFVVLGAAAARMVWRSAPVAGSAEAEAADVEARESRGRRLLWIGWSACGVVLFMAVTNQLTLNVASVPFLWILPLALYLLSFIVAFGAAEWCPRRLLALLMLPAIGTIFLLVEAEVRFWTLLHLGTAHRIGIWAAALFVLCLLCHSELYRLRPAPSRLTSFYLSIAFGGALGGCIVGILAPVLFLWYQELHLGLLGCWLLFLVTALAGRERPAVTGRVRWASVLSVVALVGFAGLLARQTWTMLDGSVSAHRSFFGFLRVQEVGRGDPGAHALKLYDGSTLHGHQFLEGRYRELPTLYYSTLTGVAGVLLEYDRPAGRRIGIVGLGIGTLAAYAEPNDRLRFYEINPDVIELAATSFEFLRSSRAPWEIVLGDARLKLEQEPPQGFDVLVLDAFSSDSIPVHLLTAEAFAVYDRHLKPEGVIAINVSNHHLDLAGVVSLLAAEHGLAVLGVHNRDRGDRITAAATWMILSRDRGFLDGLRRAFAPLERSGDVRLAVAAPVDPSAALRWTDNYSSLFSVLK